MFFILFYAPLLSISVQETGKSTIKYVELCEFHKFNGRFVKEIDV
jgi:hypothetical protein